MLCFKNYGYEVYEDDGYTTYTKMKIDSGIIRYKDITFCRLERKVNTHIYRKNQAKKLIPNGSNMKMTSLNMQELKAINEKVKELGWEE